MRNNPWTDLEESKLAEVYPALGLDQARLALGRTHDSVKKKAAQLGLKSPIANQGGTRKYFAGDIANIMELRTMGFSLDNIAKCFNSTASAIYYLIWVAERGSMAKYPSRGA